MICSPHQIKKNEMGWACSTMGCRRDEYRVFVEKPGGRNHSEDPGVDRREDKIKMDLQEVRCGGMDWIGSG